MTGKKKRKKTVRKAKKNKAGDVVGTKYTRLKTPRIPQASRTTAVWVKELSEVKAKRIFVASRTGGDYTHQGTVTIALAGENKEAVDHAMRWMADILFPTAFINGRVMNPITLVEALGANEADGDPFVDLRESL